MMAVVSSILRWCVKKATYVHHGGSWWYDKQGEIDGISDSKIYILRQG